jgi:hypothetical protein
MGVCFLTEFDFVLPGVHLRRPRCQASVSAPLFAICAGYSTLPLAGSDQALRIGW